MINFKTVFWFSILILVFFVGLKVVPINYRGIFGLRSICQEYADVYHKYGLSYITRAINEDLTNIGVPKSKRQLFIDRTEDAVIITIIYEDQTNFFDKYYKTFKFQHECEGVLKSVYE